MKYKLFIVTDQKTALLKGNNGKIYLSKPPYKVCEEINHSEYIMLAYSSGGVVQPDRGEFRSLKEIRSAIKNG